MSYVAHAGPTAELQGLDRQWHLLDSEVRFTTYKNSYQIKVTDTIDMVDGRAVEEASDGIVLHMRQLYEEELLQLRNMKPWRHEPSFLKDLSEITHRMNEKLVAARTALKQSDQPQRIENLWKEVIALQRNVPE